MKNSTLTPCEAEVMNVVWSRDSVTVQDVVDAIPRQLAYTTVMTTIRILEEKGFLKRAGKLGRALTDLPPGMEPVFKLGLVLPIGQSCSFAEA